MTATLNDLQRWFEDGVDEGMDFMIVMCDTYDHDNYPVYCSEEDFDEEYGKRSSGENMQRVEEVYDLSKEMDPQMNTHRKVFNFPKGSRRRL